MAILVDKKSRVMVQGITGGAGSFHAKRMIAYGTNIVGGTSPGKGGAIVEGKPVFDSVEECVKQQGADTSVVFLPAAFVKEAASKPFAPVSSSSSSCRNIFRFTTCSKSARKRSSTAPPFSAATRRGSSLPVEANLGIMPDIAFKPGRVGTVSRSGSLTYYIADTLTSAGYGETTCVGLGGDPVLGSTFDEILWKFEQDDTTKAVVMAGEIGGVYEERAKDVIAKMKKPVIVMIGGVFAPPGKRMGHAGAIVEGNMGTAESKLKVLEEAGAHRAKTFLDIPRILKSLNI